MSGALAMLELFSGSGEDRANIFHADKCQEDGGSIIIQRSVALIISKLVAVTFSKVTGKNRLVGK